jgi:hypothetical protein
VTAPSVPPATPLSGAALDAAEACRSRGQYDTAALIDALARDLQIAQANVEKLTEALKWARGAVMFDLLDSDGYANLCAAVAAVEFDKSHSVEAIPEEK